MKTFLLRFQEAAAASEEMATGTATKTKITGEQNDADAMAGGSTAIPRHGTATKTGIELEQSDADQMSTARTIPTATTGTWTGTAVGTEQTDPDRPQSAMVIIPR